EEASKARIRQVHSLFSNILSSATPAADTKAKRVWSGPQAISNRPTAEGPDLLEGKLSNRKDTYTKTPSVHHHHQRPETDKTTKMGKKQGRKAGNSKIRDISPGKGERSSSPATDQSWMENDFDEMREEGFSPSNFSELKEELRT
uniref:Uncharacterized protein n=1 Tax=Macaca fascicularis TaxID=9541 RepID=A0A7N9CQX4_MACFA